MSSFILDYREELKKMISELYEPACFISKDFELSTVEITARLSLIMPENSIDEHLVYETLIDLGFKPKEDPSEPLLFRWYFKKKYND